MPQRLTFIIETDKNCNLDCRYCFIPNKNQAKLNLISKDVLIKLITGAKDLRMSDILFIWHGGEPLLAGVDFFKNAVNLQKTYGLGEQNFDNAIQTNGTLIDDKWVKFFHENDIGVGVSIDGPAEIHDSNRRLVVRRASHSIVEAGLFKIKEEQKSGGVCVVVSKASLGHEQDILDYFERLEIKEIDFLPCFTPGHILNGNTPAITDEEFGDFLVKAFDIWWQKDNPNLSIRYFNEVIKFMLGGQPALCNFRADKCRPFLAIDTNGDVYPCDTFVGSGHWKLGSLIDDDLKTIFLGKTRQQFISAMEQTDPACIDCEWFQLCRGGCTFHKFLASSDLSKRTVFCESRKKTFTHIAQTLDIDIPRPKIHSVGQVIHQSKAIIDYLYIDLGNACNSDCYFCAADSTRMISKLNSNYYKSLELARRENVENLVISGGEPTIYSGLTNFIRQAKRLGYRKIQLQTNARSLKNIDYLEELINAGVTDFGTSLHGHNSEVHDHITQSPKSFIQTIQAIENISSLLGPNPPLSVNCVLTRENMHFLKELFFLLNSLDVSSIQFSYLHAIGKAKNYFLSGWPTKSSLQFYLVDLINYAKMIGKPTTTLAIEAYPFCLLRGYEKYSSDLFTKNCYSAQSSGDIVLFNITSERGKGPNCKLCSLNGYCIGPWRQYAMANGWEEFIPITKYGPEVLFD